MARTSQDRRRRGTAPQAVVASEAVALFVGSELASNGRDAGADAGVSAVAVEEAAFVEAAVRQDIGQENGLCDIGQAGLASAHPLHRYLHEIGGAVIKGWVGDPQTPSERDTLERSEGKKRLCRGDASAGWWGRAL